MRHLILIGLLLGALSLINFKESDYDGGTGSCGNPCNGGSNDYDY